MMKPDWLLIAATAALTLNMVLLVRFMRLQRRHRKAKQALNRVASERDELRWKQMLADRPKRGA